MTQLEINRLLNEKVMGECWHERSSAEYFDTCGKCGRILHNNFIVNANPDFSLDQFYGPMIRKCMEKEWWLEFLYGLEKDPCTIHDIVKMLLTPARGSAAVAEFLEGKYDSSISYTKKE